MTKMLLLISLSLLLQMISKGQVTKTNLLDSLIKAKVEISHLKNERAAWEKEIKELKALLAVHELTDSLRFEIALLRQKIVIDEDNCFRATQQIKELKAENKKLKKKWMLEAGGSLVIIATAIYLTFK
jgi:hypothetical protein